MGRQTPNSVHWGAKFSSSPPVTLNRAAPLLSVPPPRRDMGRGEPQVLLITGLVSTQGPSISSVI